MKQSKYYKISFLDILEDNSLTKKIKIIKIFDYILGIIFLPFIFKKSSKSCIEDIKGIKRILVIRPGGIGDAVLVLQFINKLNNIFSNPKIDVLCEKRNFEIFIFQEGINHIFLFDRLSDILKLIFIKEYDVVFDTEQWHNTSAILTYFLKTKISIGFDTRPLRKKAYRYSVEYVQDMYEMLNFLNLLSPLNIVDNKMLYAPFNFTFTIKKDTQEWAFKKIPKNTIALFLKGSRREKCFDNKIIVKILNFLIKKGFFILLIGGKEFIAEHIELKYLAEEKDKIFDFTGKTTLNETAALIKNCILYIGSDTGLTHLAYVLGIPTIAIFGLGNEKKWSPPAEWAYKYASLNLHTHTSVCTVFGYTLPRKGDSPCFGKMRVADINALIEKKFPDIL